MMAVMNSFRSFKAKSTSHKISILRIILTVILTINIVGCENQADQNLPNDNVFSSPNAEDSESENNQKEEVARNENWDEITHGNNVIPDYEIVFPQDTVNRIDISINSDNWQGIRDNMTELLGEQGTGTSPSFRGNPQNNALDREKPPTGMPNLPGDKFPSGPNGREFGGNNPPGGGNFGMAFSEVNPDYFEATISFNNQIWENVGFRFKGNSTMNQTWKSGSLKISFKLDFDEFENTYPEIENQRFYGFKQLSFASNALDDSFLREKITADIFRDAGVVAPQTAYYQVFIDYGEGPVYFGLYTLVEVVDDTVIKTQFKDDSGNVYKPEGTGATFAEGAFDETSFAKQSNSDEADWSDIKAVFDALHDKSRLSDSFTWRKNLEKVFNTDAFLHWLAVDTIVQNWDTYGVMAHNYYLYNDPVSQTLTWIPWDNNMALSGQGRIGKAKTFSQSEADDQWPLISYLIADPEYVQVYKKYLDQTITNSFTPDVLTAKITYYHDLIQPYITGENGENSGYTNISSPEAFENAYQELLSYVNERYDETIAFLNENR